MTQSMEDLIRRKRQEMEQKKAVGANVIRPLPGKHKYRILPTWRDNDLQFWHDFALHYIKAGPEKKIEAVYVCADKTFGESCPICAAISNGIRSTSDDPTVQLLKGAYASQKYLLNVLHLTGDKPTEPQLMEIGVKVFDQICEIVEEYGDITDLNSGVDVIINRQGSGLDTTYGTVPAPKSNPVPEAVLDKLVDIDGFVNQRNPTNEARALAAVAKILGIESSGQSAPPLAAKSHMKSVSYAEAEDADFEPSGLSAAEDAELDDLLDEIA